MAADFDPRLAALRYAAESQRQEYAGGDESAGDVVQALVCGLVYVGDQVGRLAEYGPEPEWTPADVAAAASEPPLLPASAFVRVFVGDREVTTLVQALRRIAEYVEHIGDGPADDEMRGIARKALTEFERGGDDG